MNKKGFSLVELLAVIIILVILVTLGYAAVSSYIGDAHDTTYESFESSLVDGATNYLLEHSGNIPNEGESLVIDTAKLICDGYVDELIDPRDETKTCNLNSYTIVKRNNNSGYNMDLEYTACLKCSDYQSPGCSKSISGFKRLKKDASCEVD